MSNASAFERLMSGDQAALARAITVLENENEESEALMSRLLPLTGRARIIAVTGPPGAGKSTLVDALTAEFRVRGERVAVLAVDPSSPISGGAVLGDRVRMGQHSSDEGVFVRSIANRGHVGGLSGSISGVIHAVDVAGWPNIIIETVGAGQSETEVSEYADVNVVVNAPGLGDDVQAIKAGILEIADILVVNKADLPDADRTIRQLQSMLKLRAGEMAKIPVLATIASRGDGISELASTISNCASLGSQKSQQDRALGKISQALKRRALAHLELEIAKSQDRFGDALAANVETGLVSLERATLALVDLALSGNSTEQSHDG